MFDRNYKNAFPSAYNSFDREFRKRFVKILNDPNLKGKMRYNRSGIKTFEIKADIGMIYVIKFLYGFVLPPGLFVTGTLLLGLFAYRRDKVLARCFLFLSFLLYLFFIPFTGHFLIHTLEKQYTPPKEVSGDVIIMLGGGATFDTPDIDGKGHLYGSAANRLLTAARLHNQTGLPIVISGGTVYPDNGSEADIAKRQLVSLGIEQDAIFVETKSRNTEENAKYTKELLKKEHFQKPILVTSAYHMPRAVNHFHNVGLTVEPYPTDYSSNQNTEVYPNQFSPAMITSTYKALKEYLGMLAN
jgi:uncharacterized SAM-binding protein YcdF (DUF218 family)